MSERKKTIFTDLRDKHGVADLLREVSARKSALTPKHRREVNNIVDRMGGASSHTSNETHTLSDHSDSSSSLDDSDRSFDPMNKWGNNFLQKFNRPAQQNPLKAQSPPQFFRKFSIQRMQKQQDRKDNPANDGNNNDRREEIRKTLERSQQQGKEMLQRSQEQGKEMLQRSQEQGKEMMQKFSSNFQNLSNHVRTSLNIPTNAEKAAEVSQTFKQLEKLSVHSSRRPLDMNSTHSRYSIGKSSNHSISSFDEFDTI